jgi:hypothetical protein
VDTGDAPVRAGVDQRGLLRLIWRSSFATSWSIEARMSPDASRARRTGPFVQIVASATLFAAIDGFFSTASSSSMRGSVSWRSSLPSFASA